MYRHARRIYVTDIEGSQYAVDLIAALVSKTLGCVQDLWTQLPVRSCGIVVITVNLPAGSAMYGR